MLAPPAFDPKAYDTVRITYLEQFSNLDLTNEERDKLAGLCAAYWLNHYGEGPSDVGIQNLANGIRSRRKQCN